MNLPPPFTNKLKIEENTMKSGKTYTCAQVKMIQANVRTYLNEEAIPRFISEIIKIRSLSDEKKMAAITVAKKADYKKLSVLYSLLGKDAQQKFKEEVLSMW